MIGTLLNAGAIAIGGMLGLLLGGKFLERVRQTLIASLGIFTLAYGVQMFLKSQNPLFPLGGIVLGTVLGEWWQIETGMEKLAKIIERRIPTGAGAGQSIFGRGFLVASVLYCTGPVAVLGSIQDGLSGDYNLLAVKAVLDGIASIVFASSLGMGVVFSSIVVLIYQGLLTLLAVQAQYLITPMMMNEMSAAGGILMMGMALGSILDIKPIRAGNMLPALLITPVLVWLAALLGLV